MIADRVVRIAGRQVTVRVYDDIYFFRCDGPECPRRFHPYGCVHAKTLGSQMEAAGTANKCQLDQFWTVPKRLLKAAS